MANDERIEQLTDERSIGNGWFVYLKPGWQYDGAHCFGEDNRRAVRRTMKMVRPCRCPECMNR